MYKTLLAIALASSPLLANAQQVSLSPTGTPNAWQVSCSTTSIPELTIVQASQPTGQCNSAWQNALIVNPNANGWADPTPTPTGASYISVVSDGNLWFTTPDENPHYLYTFRTYIDLSTIKEPKQLIIPELRFDNYFVGFSINGGALYTDGVSPLPLAAPGGNWQTLFSVNRQVSEFTSSSNNYIDFVIAGNGRTDGLLLSGFVVPEPTSIVLVATGLLGLAGVRMRRKA